MSNILAVLILFLLPYSIGQLSLLTDRALRPGGAEAAHFQKTWAAGLWTVAGVAALADTAGLLLLAPLLWVVAIVASVVLVGQRGRKSSRRNAVERRAREAGLL